MRDFAELFSTATDGATPYAYQRLLADDGLPDALEVPTGSGKSAAVVLAWLWRRLYHPENGVRVATPRRLIVALPMRTLVDQFASEIEAWLERLNLSSLVDLHVVMGGRLGSQHAWRMNMHRPAIVLGTIDTVISKTLNRGYGASRSTYPLDFALTTNGAHLVVDEIQLAPQGSATLRQVVAFGREFGTAEPIGLTCMSATLLDTAMDTVDNPWPAENTRVGLSPADRAGELGRRLVAQRRIERLECEPGDSKLIAEALIRRHLAGTRTLAIVNTVATAVNLFKSLQKVPSAAPCVLLHSRFRPAERAAAVAQAVAQVDADGPGIIVVSTQVIEAGVDITSRTLFTEAATWSSLVQRVGRCNRYGESAEATVLWLPPKNHLPYPDLDVEATSRSLTELGGQSVSVEDLLAKRVFQTPPELHIVRRRDFLDLFDTAPDLSGNDIDVSIYIRDTDDIDAQVAWLDINGRPELRGRQQLPPQETRCSVPLGQIPALAKGRRLWRYDPERDQWVQIKTTGRRARPGELLIATAHDGGYDPQVGLDVNSRTPVPVIRPTEEWKESATIGASTEDQQADEGSLDQPGWLTLDQHLAETQQHALALLSALSPDLPDRVAEVVAEAAGLHDIGKSFPPWQEALRNLAAEGDRPNPADVHAKSPLGGRLVVRQHEGFRHELFSALLLDAYPDLARLDPPDLALARYLIAAHHGRVRIQARDSLLTERAKKQGVDAWLLGLEDGSTVKPAPFLGRNLDALTIDLSEFRLGGEASWTRESLSLLERYGPFVLAYAETLVRIADWRASAQDVPLASEATS